MTSDIRLNPSQFISSLEKMQIELNLKGPNFRYVPFDGTIPCVHIWGEWPDSLRRLNRSNIIQKSLTKLTEGLKDIREELQYQKRLEAGTKVKKLLPELISDSNEIIKNTKTIFTEDTNLHRERRRVYHEAIQDSVKKIEVISKKKIVVPEEEIKKIEDHLKILKRFAKDPEHSFPNVEISLSKKDKNVAQCALKAQNISLYLCWRHDFMKFEAPNAEKSEPFSCKTKTE